MTLAWKTRRRHRLLASLQKRVRTRRQARRQKCPITHAVISKKRQFGVVRNGVKLVYDAHALAEYIDHSSKTKDPMTREPFNSVELRRLGRICVKSGRNFLFPGKLKERLMDVSRKVVKDETERYLKVLEIMLCGITVSTIDARTLDMFEEYGNIQGFIDNLAILFVMCRPTYRQVMTRFSLMCANSENASRLIDRISLLTNTLIETYTNAEIMISHDAARVFVNIRMLDDPSKSYKCCSFDVCASNGNVELGDLI